MIAVDTNVLAYLLIAGQHSDAAERLLRHDSDWGAPVLWRSELRNVLAGDLRRGDLTFEQVCERQALAEDLMQGGEYTVSSPQVWMASAAATARPMTASSSCSHSS